MPDLILPKRLLWFWITIPYAKHLILLSPQICPSLFWLFGYLKGVFQGISFEEPDELLFALQEILTELDRETLDVVSQE
jgi:hypothetical protein